jgi:hypothetical protein
VNDPAIPEHLAAIERDCPAWHCWRGVGGILYARRLKSSPPIIVRAADPAQLREAIAVAISERCKLR